MTVEMDRRAFLSTVVAGAGALAVGSEAWGQAARPWGVYPRVNVVIVRFGGGVRRRETVDPDHTCAPYLRHVLAARGTLFPRMTMARAAGPDSSHVEGTLNILTGSCRRPAGVGERNDGARPAAEAPTLFEALRAAYDVPAHQTLVVDGEDGAGDPLCVPGNRHLFGAAYGAATLSPCRRREHLLRGQAAGSDGATEAAGDAIGRFWDGWRDDDDGARGDRLLTRLALRAMRELRPRLMMINYQDPDRVHWGDLSAYTGAIDVMDEGLRQLVDAAEADGHYRGNTVFVVAPDCGRDSNPYIDVPCQHHFNSRSSREVWALFVGPGVREGVVVDGEADQASIAPTVARLMGFPLPLAEGRVLEEALV